MRWDLEVDWSGCTCSRHMTSCSTSRVRSTASHQGTAQSRHLADAAGRHEDTHFPPLPQSSNVLLTGRSHCCKTSCRRAAATIWLRPCKLTISSYLFARWHLFQTSWPLTCWPWKWCPSQCHVWLGYICANFSANFSLSRPLCSRVTPDVRDRRQIKASLVSYNGLCHTCASPVNRKAMPLQ